MRTAFVLPRKFKYPASFADGQLASHPRRRSLYIIQLTRLNNTRLAVNCDLIKFVEEAPDTVITLLNGEKLVVRETTADVIECVRQFRRSVLTGDANLRSLPPPAGARTGDSAARHDVTIEGPVCG